MGNDGGKLLQVLVGARQLLVGLGDDARFCRDVGFGDGAGTHLGRQFDLEVGARDGARDEQQEAPLVRQPKDRQIDAQAVAIAGIEPHVGDRHRSFRTPLQGQQLIVETEQRQHALGDRLAEGDEIDHVAEALHSLEIGIGPHEAVKLAVGEEPAGVDQIDGGHILHVRPPAAEWQPRRRGTPP